MIRSSTSTRVYVGSSKNIWQRWKKHLSRLKAGNHENSKLQRGWKNSTFSVHLLEECGSEHLLGLEQWWIHHLDAVGSGFNLSRLANRPDDALSASGGRLGGLSSKLRGRLVENARKARAAITPERRKEIGRLGAAVTSARGARGPNHNAHKAHLLTCASCDSAYRTQRRNQRNFCRRCVSRACMQRFREKTK
jgi:group I intron endonuclease